MNKKIWITALLLQSLAFAEAGTTPLQTSSCHMPCPQEAIYVATPDNVGSYVSQRPPVEKRLFRSDAIEIK